MLTKGWLLLLALAGIIGVGPMAPAGAQAPAQPSEAAKPPDIEPELDRWRLLAPLGSGVIQRTPLFLPYEPNVLKGDYPVFGDHLFFAFTGVLDSFLDQKTNLDFSSRIKGVPFYEHNTLGQITALAAFELFHGDTVFTPKDWSVKVTPILRYRCNDLNATVTDTCDQDFTLLEGFGELKLFEIGRTFDTTSGRAGLQFFNSDFFGLIYNDVQPGVRVFGEIDRNRYKYNIAFFDRLNKQTLSGLNVDKRRFDEVGVVSFEWDDFIFPGFNILPNFVVNADSKLATPLYAYYLGVTTNGRLGEFNVNSAFYYVFGNTANNTPNKRSQDISAGMALAQAAYPIGFVAPRLAVAWASGDGNPRGNHAHGFDSVFDNVAFGGAQFSYLFGEKIQLGKTTLLRGNSIFPSLRGANNTSQFVNPGVLAVNPGVDVAVTPKTLFEANFNYVRFDQTATLEALTKRAQVSNELGYELNTGVTYRPLLNEQIILFGGGGVLFPGQAIKDTFGTNQTVYKFLVRVILQY